MRLYAGTTQHFLTDTTYNQIAEKLRTEFFRQYRYNPSKSEVMSWENSLRAAADIFELSKLYDHGIILEYQLPLNSRRIDCIVCGKDDRKRKMQ